MSLLRCSKFYSSWGGGAHESSYRLITLRTSQSKLRTNTENPRPTLGEYECE
jgi:hypothetical protein